MEQRRCDENYIEESQILDEALRQADEVRGNYVHRESQQLADAQERIRWLENDSPHSRGTTWRNEESRVE